MTTTTKQLIDVDIDAHEMTPLHKWEETFGEQSGRFADIIEPAMSRFGASDNNFYRPGLTDTAPITEEAVWHQRGPSAPGAFDLSRRVAVMDTMKTRRQLVFPSGAITAYGAFLGGELRDTFLANVDYDLYAPVVLGLIDEYNQWVARQTKEHGDRIRLVALLHADSPASLIEKAEALIQQGVRAIHLASGVAPGGVSPADHGLDPLWRLATESRITVVTHVAGQTGFVASGAWRQAPEFAPGKVESTEVGFEPFSMSTVHMAVTNFLTAMVLGGVFERFPDLRFGVIEFGGYWLGHLAETLDLWGGRVFRKRVAQVLSMKPSEYLSRNVRVNPFYFEDVASYFERFPHLSNSYCYASDYPHVEGGIEQKKGFYDQVAPLGADIVEKYFVTNGSWLLP
jgi:predicted TIM-barrel fold metal-dependent hydrolase